MTQAEYGILYFGLNALSFIIIWIILHKTNGLSKMVAQRNFAMSIVAEMIFIASDTVYVMAHNGVIYLGFLDRYVRLMCKEVYFFSTSMMCFFWFIYFEYMRDTDFVKEKKKVNFASLIMWAMGLLLVINLFNGFLFYIDGEGVYHRGQFFILTYILSYSYVIIAYIRTICGMLDKSYTGDKHTLVLLIVFPAVPGLAGIIQFVYPRIPVACAMLAITTLLLYLNWIDQLISLDPLTGLNNRKQLGHFYNNWMKNHNEGDTINVLMVGRSTVTNPIQELKKLKNYQKIKKNNFILMNV